ncbi:indoleacetamide hydrolase [Mesorhizobium sp. CAU 1732]|uniref:indoleacetamide hydrolase n=1 Tax=Mesorhizobium sp. CAU 1732 TaxID=3140358 RepID=UPI0032614091
METTTLLDLPLEEAVAGIRARTFSALDYCEAFIAQSERHESLNAFVSWDWDQLRIAARRVDDGRNSGPLAGIPLAIKDNINTVGLPTTAGTGALANFRPVTDATTAERLFVGGALLGAKANMHELAFGITTNNGVTGASTNPYDVSRIPGGSSGGVAVAVAARMMPAGIGTDTGASVRLPAALCGLVGFRPSVGRYSGEGIVPISHTRDIAGPMTRSVADAILIDAVLTESKDGIEPVSLKELRIGLPNAYFFEDLDPEIAAIAAQFIEALERQGVTFVRADIENLEALNAVVGFPIALYEFMQDIPAFLKAHDIALTMDDLLRGIGSADVKGIVASQMGSDAMPAEAYAKALNEDRPRLQAAYADYFRTHAVDAVLFPTAPLAASPIGDDETVELNGRRVPTFPTFIRNTDPASNAGIPGISLPAGLTRGGLPVGMELDGPAGSDRRLLAIARAVEEAAGFTSAPKIAGLSTQ